MRKPVSKLHEDFPVPRFDGFSPAAFQFFKNLSQNQDRTWFAGHKHVYESEIVAVFASLIAELAARFEKRKIPLAGDAKRSLFRINRDVRFSNDKSPYKTHAGAVMTRTGNKNSPGVLYIHLDPGGCFVASGFYQPSPLDLQIMRAGLVHHATAWTKLERDLAASGLALSREDALVRPPIGFTSNPQIEAALKLKSWVVRRDLTLAAMKRPDLVDHI
jgi:uncharacterized protein (TIGR02453 family)